MAQYEDFNKYNVAPPGAKQIGVYNSDGNKVGRIPLGALTPPNIGERLYSFGVLADLHIGSETGAAIPAFERAMEFFAKNNDIEFVCIAGDLVEDGANAEHWEAYGKVLGDKSFLLPNDKGEGKRVYGIAGNHEYLTNEPDNSFVGQHTGYSWNGGSDSGDDGVCYSFEKQGDVFIMLGVEKPAILGETNSPCQGMLNVSDADRVRARFEANRNKRCFVFQHYEPPVGSDNKKVLTSTHYGHYKNSIVFHGHTHHEFEKQTADAADKIYTKKDGYRSVHIPSCNDRSAGDSGRVVVHQGYIVDVYPEKIHLIGIDFKTDIVKYVPLGIYAIDTTVVDIEAKTET